MIHIVCTDSLGTVSHSYYLEKLLCQWGKLFTSQVPRCQSSSQSFLQIVTLNTWFPFKSLEFC